MTAARTVKAPVYETVGFHSDGFRLSGWLYRGAPGAGPLPAFIVCPGFTGTKYASFYQPYVAALTAAGADVLLFDYRGWGDSEGRRGDIMPLAQVADIRNAITYLQSRGDLAQTGFVPFGMSFGGAHALYAAAVDERVSGVVAISPVADGRAWLRGMRRAYEWEEFLAGLEADRLRRVSTGQSSLVDPAMQIMLAAPERAVIGNRVKGAVPVGKTATHTALECAEAILEYRVADVAGRIAPRPVLVFYTPHDSVVPPAEQVLPVFAAAGQPKRLVELARTSHYAAYVQCFGQIDGEIQRWLGELFSGR